MDTPEPVSTSSFKGCVDAIGFVKDNTNDARSFMRTSPVRSWLL